MNALVFLFFIAMTTVMGSALGSSNCPSGLPAEILRDCSLAESDAEFNEDPDFFGKEIYNVTEKLQAWVDRQMQLNVVREDTEPTGSDVAQQTE